MLHKSTIQLLRFPFSLFLLPVYLWGVATQPNLHIGRALLIFLILHLLVYPASNGYNSYMDRDTTSIGGVREPLLPTRQLFLVTIAMDALAILAGLLIDPLFAICITVYILASHAYSFRSIRLKQYPLLGYIVVVSCQGALTYAMVYHGSSGSLTKEIPLWATLASSLLIGASYPLTQIYQHATDRADGVTTISYRLGLHGTFLFSAVLFSLALGCMAIHFDRQQESSRFFYILILFLPALLYFLNWARAVWKDRQNADFFHAMRMNMIASTCISIAFFTLAIWNHIH